jgi:hypothetical protein
VLFIPIIIVWILGSLLVAALGRRRKFGFWGYFFCSLLFSPLMGLLFLAASDKPPRIEENVPHSNGRTAGI